MKQFLLLVLLLPLMCFSQDIPTKDGKVFYEQVDSLDGIAKAELFNRSKVWFVNTFKSANAVLQLEDKETGNLMGKAITNYEAGNLFSGPSTSHVHYTININVRDGKCRIQLYDLYVSNTSNAITYTPEYLLKYPKMNRKKIEHVDACAKELLAEYRAAMVKGIDNNF